MPPVLDSPCWVILINSRGARVRPRISECPLLTCNHSEVPLVPVTSVGDSFIPTPAFPGWETAFSLGNPELRQPGAFLHFPVTFSQLHAACKIRFEPFPFLLRSAARLELGGRQSISSARMSFLEPCLLGDSSSVSHLRARRSWFRPPPCPSTRSLCDFKHVLTSLCLHLLWDARYLRG